MCLSTLSNCSLEDVAAAGTGPKWFQLYIHRDHSVAVDLVQRAETAGYEAIVVTVDLPVLGYRDAALRAGLPAPDLVFGSLVQYAERSGGDEFFDAVHDESVTWRDLEWVREASALPLVVKGVLTSADAALAVEHGAAAVIVSNHGGRQLDQSPATLDVLEDIVETVDGRAEVYLDGGVRRGTDVVSALAIGARGVFVGRPYLYGLAVAGERGVGRVLELLEIELENAMALLGAPAIEDITRDHVS